MFKKSSADLKTTIKSKAALWPASLSMRFPPPSPSIEGNVPRQGQGGLRRTAAQMRTAESGSGEGGAAVSQPGPNAEQASMSVSRRWEPWLLLKAVSLRDPPKRGCLNSGQPSVHTEGRRGTSLLPARTPEPPLQNTGCERPGTGRGRNDTRN